MFWTFFNTFAFKFSILCNTLAGFIFNTKTKLRARLFLHTLMLIVENITRNTNARVVHIITIRWTINNTFLFYFQEIIQTFTFTNLKIKKL